MKKGLLFVCCFSLMLLTMGCDDDKTERASGNILVSFAKTGCKSSSMRSGDNSAGVREIIEEESISYEGTSDNCLFITHNNTIFACESEITASATIDGRVITLTENGTNETNCLCPYDLTMKVGPLTYGTYQVVLLKEDLEYMTFTINYTNKVSGKELIK